MRASLKGDSPLALVIIIVMFAEDICFHERETSSARQKLLPAYHNVPAENAPPWLREDIGVITIAMVTWVAPAMDPAWKDAIEGCRTNSRLTSVARSFRIGLERRLMLVPLALYITTC